MILESRTSLITGATIAIGTILGYSAMAGTVGGGGLGDIAIRYGYYRYDSAIMIVTVVLLVVLVQVFQSVGMVVASRLIKENRQKYKIKQINMAKRKKLKIKKTATTN